MLGKIITSMVILSLLFVYAFSAYQNMPRSPIKMVANQYLPNKTSSINYGNVPVFGKNMRFNHNMISYSISKSCSKPRRDAMVEAFILLANRVKIISFYEVKKDADIDVDCPDTYLDLGKNMFAAGEGGPSEIINTSLFKTIEKGKIHLYDDPRCNYPVVEIHELLHVFGFAHSHDPNNIMYNVSSCNQKISKDVITLLQKLYSVQALPDAMISELNATTKGKYLNFNITIINDGLSKIKSIDLTVVVDGKSIKTINLGSIDIGYGRTIRAENIRLPSWGVSKVDFVVDKDNKVKELYKNNNFAEMVVGSNKA